MLFRSGFACVGIGVSIVAGWREKGRTGFGSAECCECRASVCDLGNAEGRRNAPLSFALPFPSLQTALSLSWYAAFMSAGSSIGPRGIVRGAEARWGEGAWKGIAAEVEAKAFCWEVARSGVPKGESVCLDFLGDAIPAIVVSSTPRSQQASKGQRENAPVTFS